VSLRPYPLALCLLVTAALAACGDAAPKPAVPVAPAATEDAGLSEPEEIDPSAEFAAELTGHRRQRYEADLAAIKKRGVLRVLSVNSSTSYFLHRGAEAGFNYELAKLFADELGVRMEMVVPRAARDLIPWLLQGRGDIIIGSLATDAPRAGRVKMTRPYMRTGLVVVTRKGRVPALNTVLDLSTATLAVHPSSTAMKRLRALSSSGDTMPVSLNLSAVPETLQEEDMLDDVANGNSDAAVVQRRVASVELAHNADLEIALELPVGIVESAFAVRPKNTALYEAADDFLRRNYRGTVFNILYARYHKATSRSAAAQEDELRADKEGALTEWDDLFQKAGDDIGVDWRLLAAQAYQESRLDPKAKSSFGAQGLMQVMPATAKEVGIKDPWDPADSIRGGSAYLKKVMDRYFNDEGIALKDRIRLGLAAYNVGPGHIADARRLAEEQGLDKNRWFGNVEKTTLLLSKPRYYKKARYGYARGQEPVSYVSQIQSRYDAYVAATTEEPPQ
jgi:membrane-bound lytic murein transglycosylase F